MSIVKPYEQCVLRYENRGNKPPTREYVDDLVKAAQEIGWEASWHSAVDYAGRPLFPSRVFPNCHKDASIASFRYLIDSMHAIGRPVLSWYPLAICRAVLEAYPDWETQFYQIEGQPEVKNDDPKFKQMYACFNSPYGELLPKFAAEIVGELGFDGVWFDGATMSYIGGQVWPPGCKCHFCRERFKHDTGLDLPERIDFEERTVRLWINWRYDVFMDVWKRVTEAVTAGKPDALVCFNNLRRRHSMTMAWNTAIPLRILNFDCMMSGESDNFCGQADMQMKMNRAYGCKRGVETHWCPTDYWNWGPDVESLPAVQYMLGGISAGGVAATGSAGNPRIIANVLGAMQNSAAPVMKYLGGRTVEYAAILCSQQTQDFVGRISGANEFFNEWHAANEALREGHVQSSVIFDDHITQSKLSEYPMVILGNGVCVSAAQARQLERYVQEGGALLACHKAGEMDELGYLHKRPILDDLLGIKSRRTGVANAPTLEILDEEIKAAGGRWVTFGGTPYQSVIAQPASGVEVLADIFDVPFNIFSPNWDANWIDRYTEEPVPEPRSPGLWLRRAGQGVVAYTGINLFLNFMNSPTPHMLRMLMALMHKMATPAIELDGPLCVTLNCREQEDGRWAVHLHNAPGSAHRYVNIDSNYLHSPGEVVPVQGLRLKLNGRTVISAESGVSGVPFNVINGGREVDIPTLNLHDVVLLKMA